MCPSGQPSAGRQQAHPIFGPRGIASWSGTLPHGDGALFGRAATRMESIGVAALLVNRLPRALVAGTLPLVREHTALPQGVYPNLGTYRDPGWAFDPDAAPDELAADAVRWRDDEGRRSWEAAAERRRSTSRPWPKRSAPEPLSARSWPRRRRARIP